LAAMLFIAFLSILCFANARVTFPNSEILQAPDIAGTNKVNFKCANQCKLYADRKYNLLMITQQGGLIANFNTIVSGNSFVPAGIVLPPGDDYYLENRGEVNPEFVLYIVDSTAPNYGAPVYAPQQTIGIAMAFPSRYATILSSYEAMWWSGFAGAFPTGYPRVYATGFDAANDDKCHPVYQARSQFNAEVSWPTIATAVQTIDFGFVGDHNVSVNYRKLADANKGVGSVIYTSPGYVGCTFNNGQNYHSPLNEINDSFKLNADSLDIEKTYNALQPGEPVRFRVNGENLDIVGSAGPTLDRKHYDKGAFNVEVSWIRTTPSSSFAMQLDFGSSNDGGLRTTTKIGRSLSALGAVFVIIAACLWV
ncbi:hypothetical protein PMAYCL1PPCAC_00912, partial [Pristionchus mayeri]